jgi:hypothetical protein
MLEEYRKRVEGTNIDPRSLLSTDYFNHFSTVIMLLGMLPDSPDLLDEIDAWQYISYEEHFKTSTLDFAPLAIEAYAHAPMHLRMQLEVLCEQMKLFVIAMRVKLRAIHQSGEKGAFAETARFAARQLERMVETGSSIVHGNDNALDQSGIDKLF